MAGREQSVESREPPRLVPASNCTVPFASGIPSSGYMQFFFFQSILGISIFYSTFLKVIKQEDSFCISTSPSQLICFPHLHLLKTWEVWDLPLSVPFVFMAFPLSRKSNGMDYFGLWEDLPSPCWGYEKQPKHLRTNSLKFTSHTCAIMSSLTSNWNITGICSNDKLTVNQYCFR